MSDEIPVAPTILIPGVDDVDRHTRFHYGDAKHERHPHGIVIVNGQEVATTLQCPHCALHFISRKGSGHRRSFCMRCEAVTCGREMCVKGCRPFVETDGLETNMGREI